MTMMTRLKWKRHCCSTSDVVMQQKGGSKRHCPDDQYWGFQLLEHIHHSLAAPPPQPPSSPMILWHEGRDYWFLGMKEASGGGYYLYLPNNKPIPGKIRTCVGSSLGYLLLYHVGRELNPYLSLFDPLNFTNFCLPPIMPTTKSHGHGIRRAVLWEHGGGGGVMALHHVDKQLVFAKFGGATQFAELEGQDHEQVYPCNEMICIDSRIYAINYLVHRHRLEAWDCSDADHPPKKVLGFQPTFSYSKGLTMRTTLHLVELLGELLVVAIWRPDITSIIDSSSSNPICMVYKMDFKEKEWVRLDSLGDHVLFIMEFQTFSLCAKDFPQYHRNSVYFRLYFADRKRKTCVGIFNMEDGSLKQIGIDIMQA